MRTGVSRDIVRDGGGTVPEDGEKVPLSIPDPVSEVSSLVSPDGPGSC